MNNITPHPTAGKMRFGLLTHIRESARAPGKYFRVNDAGEMAKETLGRLTASRYQTFECSSLGELATWMERVAVAGQHLTTGISQHEEALVVPEKDRDQHAGVVITRSNKDLTLDAGPGLLCIDSDAGDQVISRDEVWGALCDAQPDLVHYTCLQSTSSSSNVVFSGHSTGVRGLHTFLHVIDASDIPRALEALHVRLCLAGHSRHKLSKDGKFLPRSFVDQALRIPSQPIFLRAHVTLPVEQHKEVFLRHSILEHVDTRAVVPDLTEDERARYATHLAEAETAMKPKLEAQKTTYIAQMAADQGTSVEEARIRLEAIQETKELPQDHPVKVGNEWLNVGQILAEPERWHGVACHDPLEPDYGSGTVAKIYSNQKQPVIRSFAHGDTVYKLPVSAAWSAQRSLAKMTPPEPGAVSLLNDAVEVRVGDVVLLDRSTIAVAAHWKMSGDARYDELCNRAVEERCKVEFRQKVDQQVSKDRVRLAEQQNTHALTVILGDPNNWPAEAQRIVKQIAAENLAFVFMGNPAVIRRTKSAYANVNLRDGKGEKIIGPDGNPATEPAWDTRAKVMAQEEFMVASTSVAYVIDSQGVGAHIPQPLVQYVKAFSGEHLKPLRAIAQHPVMWRGGLLFGDHVYHPDSGLFLCTDDIEVAEWVDPAQAYQFLRHDWLGDFPFESDRDALVAIMQAATLLVVKSDLLTEPGPPVTLFNALSPGIGKSLLQNVLHVAITGSSLPTVMWPESPEERQKLVLAMVLDGTTHLALDNLANGSTLGNRQRELLQLTGTGMIGGRILGKSTQGEGFSGLAVSANGNGIGVAGDMVSRILECRLVSPESGSLALRCFRHPNIVQWTKDNRGQIIGALACIMMRGADAKPTCRFPIWQRIVADPLVAVSGVTDLFDEWIEAGETDAAGIGSEKLEGVISAMSNLARVYEDGSGPVWWTATELVEAIRSTTLNAVFGYREPSARELAKYLKQYRGKKTDHGRLLGAQVNLGERTGRQKRWVFRVE